MRIAWFLREHRVVAGVILFDLVIVVVLIVMMIVKAGKAATVDILTVPSIAKVKIGSGGGILVERIKSIQVTMM